MWLTERWIGISVLMDNAVATNRKSQVADSLGNLAVQLAVGREYRTLKYFCDSLLRRVGNLPADRVAREIDPLIPVFSRFIMDSTFDEEQVRRPINGLIGFLLAQRIAQVPQELDEIDRLLFNEFIPRFMTASKTADAKTMTRAAEGVGELPRILCGFIIASDLERFNKLADVLPTLLHDELKNQCYAQFQLGAANLMNALSAWQQMGDSKAQFSPHVEQLLRAMISVQEIVLEDNPKVVGPLADNILAVMRALVEIEYAERMFPVALDALESECNTIDKKPGLRSHLLADLEKHAFLAARDADPRILHSVLRYWSRENTGISPDLSLRFAGVVAKIKEHPDHLKVSIQFALEEYRFLATAPVQDFHRTIQYPLFIATIGIERKSDFPDGFKDLIGTILQRLQEPAREAVRKNVRILWREMVKADMSDQVWEKTLAI